MDAITAGHRVIIKRAMRAVGLYVDPEWASDYLDSWARNNPVPMAKSLRLWFEKAARAWVRYNNQEAPTDESDTIRDQAESVIKAMSGGAVKVDFPGLYPTFEVAGRAFNLDLLAALRWACATHKVTRDGCELFRSTEADCFGWLQGHQSASVHHATKYEGYKIESLEGGGK